MVGIFVFAAISALFASFITFAFIYSYRQLRRSTENLTALAQRLGLTVHPAPKKLGLPQLPELKGERRGRPVRIFNYSTGSGKSRTEWSAVAATVVIPSRLTFRLSEQGFGSKVLRVFGVRELVVGDPEFDRRWFVQTNAPEFLGAALIPELRAKLNALRERGGKGAIETVEGTIRYAEPGWFSDPARGDRIAEALDCVCDLAAVAEVYAEQ